MFHSTASIFDLYLRFCFFSPKVFPAITWPVFGQRSSERQLETMARLSLFTAADLVASCGSSKVIGLRHPRAHPVPHSRPPCDATSICAAPLCPAEAGRCVGGEGAWVSLDAPDPSDGCGAAGAAGAGAPGVCDTSRRQQHLQWRWPLPGRASEKEPSPPGCTRSSRTRQEGSSIAQPLMPPSSASCGGAGDFMGRKVVRCGNGRA